MIPYEAPKGLCCSVRGNTPLLQTEPNNLPSTVCFICSDRTERFKKKIRGGWEGIQYGFQIKLSWAATYEKLLNFDLSSSFKKFLNILV